MRMRHSLFAVVLFAALMGLGVGILAGSRDWGDRALPLLPEARADAPDRIVFAFGVGQVLTDDGTLWVYRPDTDTWMTMDQAYRMEGKKNIRTMPLPVKVSEIREMVTWGFIVTKTGDLWLYDIDADRWKQLADPPLTP